MNVSHLGDEMRVVVFRNAGTQLTRSPRSIDKGITAMGEVHLIQPESFAAGDHGAEAPGAPVVPHREKPKRGHLRFPATMPCGRVMYQAYRGASLIAAGWSAAQVAVMLFEDLIASR